MAQLMVLTWGAWAALQPPASLAVVLILRQLHLPLLSSLLAGLAAPLPVQQIGGQLPVQCALTWVCRVQQQTCCVRAGI